MDSLTQLLCKAVWMIDGLFGYNGFDGSIEIMNEMCGRRERRFADDEVAKRLAIRVSSKDSASENKKQMAGRRAGEIEYGGRKKLRGKFGDEKSSQSIGGRI